MSSTQSPCDTASIPVGATVAEKLQHAAPYNFFLTTIASSTETHTEPNSISFHELFDSSLGDIAKIAHLNFLIDTEWLMQQYERAGCADVPSLVLYGFDDSKVTEYPNMKVEHRGTGGEYGIHHSKMTFIEYRDQSMRVIISTANLYAGDWNDRTNGLWVSPRCDRMTDNVHEGDSVTRFRADLMEYLLWYQHADLAPWIELISQCDVRAINVFLVASVPGKHLQSWRGNEKSQSYGHWRMGNLLKQHAPPIDVASPLIAQSSSVGSFGPSRKSYWLFKEIMGSFGQCKGPRDPNKLPDFRMVYPSLQNVLGSYDFLEAAAGLPYSEQVHRRQTWVQEFMLQWKADQRFRSRAMPHIKTYARWNDKQLHWFLLTSANMSKSAWGVRMKGNILSISNVEVGVLFLPQFVIDKECFHIEDDDDATVPPFPLVYDVPNVPYKESDEAFRVECIFDNIEK